MNDNPSQVKAPDTPAPVPVKAGVVPPETVTRINFRAEKYKRPPGRPRTRPRDKRDVQYY